MSHRPNVRPLSTPERLKFRAGIVRKAESDASIRNFTDLVTAINTSPGRIEEALDHATRTRLSRILYDRREPSPYEIVHGTASPRRRTSDDWRTYRAEGRARRSLTLDEMKRVASGRVPAFEGSVAVGQGKGRVPASTGGSRS